MTSLHWASYHGHTDIMTLLVEHKANLNITNKKGNTPLVFAAVNNQMAIVRRLVDARSDITIGGQENKTASEFAKQCGNLDIVEYLNHTVRFHASSQGKNRELCCVKGRSLRAIERDLKDTGIFVSHILHRLNHFCIDKHK